MTTREIELWSQDWRFGLRMRRGSVEKILKLCADAGDEETGGILVGYYTHDCRCAVAIGISDPPLDSHQGRSWFQRGQEGLQAWLTSLWTTRQLYYLGEWHFHPSNSAGPSSIDIRQMEDISNSESYQCPEPVLLIVGGIPENLVEIRACAFPRGSKHIKLRACRH